MKPLEGAQMSKRVPFAAASLSGVRRELSDWLRGVGAADDAIEDARMVVSELVANAVRHARPLADGDLLVSWALDDGGLRISVTDGGAPTKPQPVNAPVSAISGRGLSVVDSLVQDWWLDTRPSRSTVHTVLPLRLG